jgi:hypothetical protein
MEQNKIMEWSKLFGNGAVIPLNGRVDFEDGWLLKPSFIPKDEHDHNQFTTHKKPLFWYNSFYQNT